MKEDETDPYKLALDHQEPYPSNNSTSAKKDKSEETNEETNEEIGEEEFMPRRSQREGNNHNFLRTIAY